MKQKQFIQNCMQSYMKNYQHYLTGETNKIYDYTIHLLHISLGVCRDLYPCPQVRGYFVLYHRSAIRAKTEARYSYRAISFNTQV